VAISSARGHVDAVDVGKRTGGCGGGEEHLLRAALARHLHDLAAGGAAHDGIVHQQHVLAVELDRIAFSFWRTLFLRSSCPA
jgi:hypothetical protein